MPHTTACMPRAWALRDGRTHDRRDYATIAELQAGVLAAADSTSRSRRLATLQVALDAQSLPVDARAAAVWAELRVRLHDAGRRVNVNDLWIAAVAIANGLPVVTQDDDFDALADLGALEVIKV